MHISEHGDEWYAARDEEELGAILMTMMDEEEAFAEAHEADPIPDMELFPVGVPDDAERSMGAPESAVLRPSNICGFQRELVAPAGDWARWRIETSPEADGERMVCTRNY